MLFSVFSCIFSIRPIFIYSGVRSGPLVSLLVGDFVTIAMSLHLLNKFLSSCPVFAFPPLLLPFLLFCCATAAAAPPAPPASLPVGIQICFLPPLVDPTVSALLTASPSFPPHRAVPFAPKLFSLNTHNSGNQTFYPNTRQTFAVLTRDAATCSLRPCPPSFFVPTETPVEA